MNYRARRAGSIFLGFTSAIGTVVTAILVAKETPKALLEIKKLKNKKDSKKIDYFKVLAPIYWPAAAVCFATIASTTISNIISMKTEASLIATTTMLSRGWNRYKGKVKDVFGIKGDNLVQNEISFEEYLKANDKLEKLNQDTNGQKLYYEDHIGFFKCNESDLLAAITDLNQRIHTPDPNPNGTLYWTSLGFFLEDAKASLLDESKKEVAENMGWTMDYLREVYDVCCMWVHPLYTKIIKKDTGELLYTRISFFEDPIFLHESVKVRSHEKTKLDYEHEADCDMHDADAFDMYSHRYSGEEILADTKPDCSLEDNGRRFIPSAIGPGWEYLEDNKNLPNPDTISLK